MNNRVYVDAAVEGMQDPKLPRTAYVAYIVEDTPVALTPLCGPAIK
jgi:hypothetical protein